MDKGRFQETLVSLYLRLNGYFTTGLIVHSPTANRNRTEVDVLGVRFPGHTQPDRGIGSAFELDCSDKLVDIVICEVKSRGEQLRFNSGLRASREAISHVLNWAGAFEQQEIPELVNKFVAALEPEEIPKPHAPTVVGPRNLRIRGLLFSPERDNRRNNHPWFLHGPPIFNYLWQCLHPSTARGECATRYDFTLWGRELEPLVRYIKDSSMPDNFNALFADYKSRNQPTLEPRPRHS